MFSLHGIQIVLYIHLEFRGLRMAGLTGRNTDLGKVGGLLGHFGG